MHSNVIFAIKLIVIRKYVFDLIEIVPEVQCLTTSVYGNR